MCDLFIFCTSPTVRFKGHSHAVRAIQWPLRDRIFTGSWDNSISSWDVVAGACLESTKTDSSVLSLSYSLPTGIIASGQTDRHVRMWNNGGEW